jgi:hypothetical protein
MARGAFSAVVVVVVDLVAASAAGDALGDGDAFVFDPCADALTGTSSVSAAMQVPVTM